MQHNKFGNGKSFSFNEKGQKVDEDGFVTSSFTKRVKISHTCVSVKCTPQEVLVRNTTDRGLKTVSFTPEEWKAFMKGAKEGQFDIE